MVEQSANPPMPVKERPVVNLQNTPNKPRKELPKQSSLGAIFREIHEEVKPLAEEKKIILDADTVQSVWRDFLKENKDKLQNAFYSVAEKQVPQLAGDTITFTETNNISLELLQLHKMDIVRYFMAKTTSPVVQLFFKLDRKETEEKSYKTPKDRLKDMLDSNPAVLKLIEKFDLNID